ncbi:hypothetical protein TrVGV298_003636 [Trichoderma virens]|nr:hypothetical protein TrVGV298_003636 [Trichoderma virens]
MTILYIGVNADSGCFGRCTSHSCTKYLALARLNQTEDAVRKSCAPGQAPAAAALRKSQKETLDGWTLIASAVHHQHQTAPSPNPGRIPAAWKCHLGGKRGFRAPNLRAYSTCGHSRTTTTLVSRDTAFVRTGPEARTHAPARPPTHPLGLTPPVAVQPTHSLVDAVTSGKEEEKKAQDLREPLGAAGWGSGTTEPLRSPARARPDPDASQVRSTGVAAPAPSCPARRVLATCLGQYLHVPDRGRGAATVAACKCTAPSAVPVARGMYSYLYRAHVPSTQVPPAPLSSYPHPLLSLCCASTEIP